MTEPVKVMAPIAAPSDISTRLLTWIGDAKAKSLRRMQSARRDQDGGEADEGVKQRDELRHRRHLDGARPPGADGAADADAEDDEEQARSGRPAADRTAW